MYVIHVFLLLGIKTDSTGLASVTVTSIPHTSATSAAFFVLPRQQGSPSIVSATSQVNTTLLLFGMPSYMT